MASPGGHWIQLLRLRPAFEGHHVVFVTTAEGNRSDVEGYPFRLVTNADRRTKLKFAVLCAEWVRILLSERPDVIVTTGAAPGMVAVVLGKALRKRTVWIDSIANAERLSTSGVIARRFADLHLTQWEHLARPEGPHYAGSVL